MNDIDPYVQMAHNINSMVTIFRCKECEVTIQLFVNTIQVRCTNEVPVISMTELCDPCLMGEHKKSFVKVRYGNDHDSA